MFESERKDLEEEIGEGSSLRHFQLTQQQSARIVLT
jgi:hypothetical protein